jgi:hypothetical protein
LNFVSITLYESYDFGIIGEEGADAAQAKIDSLKEAQGE